MAGEIQQMINTLMARKRLKLAEDKANRPDPSAELADSTAAATLRGDYERARLLQNASKPEPKETDYGAALARIRSGQGDRADSIHVGLQPRVTAPKTPSFSTREAVDPKTGKKVFVQTNSLTGEMRSARTGYTPAQKEEIDGEKEYLGALRRSNDIQAKISDIDNVLNDPALSDGAAIDDGFGGKKYVDRKALQAERDGLVKEQKFHLRKTAGAELNSTMPAEKFAGRTVTDKATGMKFRSDGKNWKEIE